MGISGFTSRLSARAVWTTTATEHEASTDRDIAGGENEGRPKRRKLNWRSSAAVVDGPSLAYHIYYQLRKETSNDLHDLRNPLRPAYHRFGERAVAFLESLETVGLKIYTIHFDGVLPASKTDTRKGRLQKTVDRLAAFREALRVGQKARLKFTDALGFSSGVQANRIDLPEPPFLVASVMDGILRSRFAARMTVVPAEADDYCAMSAATYEASGNGRAATILTNDSDIVILSSEAETRVMMLDGLEERNHADGVEIQAAVYHPAAIARAAGLSSLLQPAFFMAEDRHITLDAAATMAKQANLEANEAYITFKQQYARPVYDLSGVTPSVASVLTGMDPRIAELTHQAMPGFPQIHSTHVEAFLPPLFEDVDRFDAWRVNDHLRLAAYRMTFSGHSTKLLKEYSRHGKRIGWTEYELAGPWRADLTEYSQWLLETKSWLSLRGDNAQLWQYVAMSGALDCLLTRGSQPLSPATIKHVLRKAVATSLDTLHVAALCQASLYTHRMVKQLLALEDAKNGLDKQLKPLKILLDDMPGIAELLEQSPSDTEEFWDHYGDQLCNAWYPSGEKDSEDEGHSSEEKEGTEERDGGQEALGSNPFSMLSM